MSSREMPALTEILIRDGQDDPAERAAVESAISGELRLIIEARSGRGWSSAIHARALILEAYSRLVDHRRREIRWYHRARFAATAAPLCREILAREARMRARSTAPWRITLDEVHDLPGHSVPHLLSLDGTLSRLEAEAPLLFQVAVLRFFGGLIVEEIAHVLGEKPPEILGRWEEAKRALAERAESRPGSGERGGHLAVTQPAPCAHA